MHADALATRQSDLVNFVNSLGGSLIVLTQQGMSRRVLVHSGQQPQL
jgi:hypothetical protein